MSRPDRSQLEHRHSAINFVTPAQRHAGEDHALLAKRVAIYKAAKEQHPERWSGEIRNWQRINIVHLNPEKNLCGVFEFCWLLLVDDIFLWIQMNDVDTLPVSDLTAPTCGMLFFGRFVDSDALR